MLAAQSKCFRAEGPEISWRAPNSRVENYWVFASHVQAIYEEQVLNIEQGLVNHSGQVSSQVWMSSIS